MAQAARWPKIASCATLAALTATVATLALLALGQGGAARLGPLRGFEIEKGRERVVARELLGAKPNLALVEAESRQALRIYPYDLSAWLRLAYVAEQNTGSFGPEGLRAYQTSYDLIAYDPYVAHWRIGLGLEHWSELPLEMKKEVIAEARLFATLNQARMVEVLQSVRNPQGALAARFLAAEIVRPKRVATGGSAPR